MKRTIYSLVFIVTLSCSNPDQNRRTQVLEEEVAELRQQKLKLDSTNKILERENENFRAEQVRKEEERQKTISNHRFDRKFIGQWKFHSMKPPATDGSMNGIICGLEKFSNTNQTFVFHLFTGNDLILSKKDETTLKGENANMYVKLNSNSGLLTLSIPGGSSWIFSKLN